ncbi:MAG: class I tRNA ligase family protein [Pseudomonadales bacterium]|nr:class I tRNA ligase family protein [Pseudomonadales bacterium]
MAHPFIPFITEEIWQQVPETIRDSGETIMLQTFPEPRDELIDDEAVRDVAWIKQVVTGTRNIRGEMNISFAQPIPVAFYNGDEKDKARLEKNRKLLEFLIKAESFEWLEAGDDVPVAATHLVGDMQVLVPMSGLIDKDAEIARLDKEITRKQKDRQRAESKINNPDFVEKAPAEVVQKEKDKLTDLVAALEKLEEQKDRVASL